MSKNRRARAVRQRPEEPHTQTTLPLREFVRQTLLETVLVSGIAYVNDILEAEREALCGPRYRHADDRSAYRAGHVSSSLVLGGRRVIVKRPRVRTTAQLEAALPSWAAWSAQDPLDERAVEQMILGVSTRDYGRSLEPLPEALRGRSTSKSAVSRRFVRGTEQQLAKLLARPIPEDLAALYVDGVHVAEHVVLCAVGVDEAGKKHVLGLCEGASENAANCKALLENLVERGLRVDRALVVVIDGSKALRQAVRAHFGDRALVQRCQEHKKRNVLDALPNGKRESVKRALREAYGTRDVVRARRMLENLARRLEAQHPGAAASLREGLEELLTVKALGLDEQRSAGCPQPT
ncbi:MAG: IS256 family transposase [Candidatus Acidiferrales bacterium]